MLKSKDIADFIETQLSEIHPGLPIPADLHLYFKSNQHVLLWKEAGASFSKAALTQLENRGIRSVWIHKTEWESYCQYLHLKKELTYTPSVNHTRLSDVVQGKAAIREKRARIAVLSRTLLGELAAPENSREQSAVTQGISKVIYSFLKENTPIKGDFAADLWEITGLNPEFTHSANVATLSVLLAMAFGKIRPKLLGQIAVAGLLHEIGITQIPYELSAIPFEALSDEKRKQYLKHTVHSVELIASFAPGLSRVVSYLVRGQHEDHSHPSQYSTFSGIAQLIALADTLDSFCNGTRDGKERSFREALDDYEKAGASEFNREFFSAIARWIRGNIPEKTSEPKAS